MQLSSILVVEGNNATRCQLFIIVSSVKLALSSLFPLTKKCVAKLATDLVESRKCQDIPVSYGSFVSCPAVYRVRTSSRQLHLFLQERSHLLPPI